MSFFAKLFGREEKKSAHIAKDRLMIAIATDRKSSRIPNLDEMRREIVEVLEKYIQIDDIEISRQNEGEMDVLEIEVIMKKEEEES